MEKTLQTELDRLLSKAIQEHGDRTGWKCYPGDWLSSEFTEARAFAAMHRIAWKFLGWAETLSNVRRGKLGKFYLTKQVSLSEAEAKEFLAGFSLLEACYLGTECQRVDRRTGEREAGVQYSDHATRATYWSPVEDVRQLGRLIAEGKADVYSIWCAETETIEVGDV